MQFKTTNNQRLLVELTLMRISSIGFVGEKKNSKSFVVSRNDVKGKVPVEQIPENNKKEPVLRDVKVTPNIKLDLGIKKRSSLISINSSFKKEKDIVEDDKDALTIRDKDFPETELLGCWKELIVFIKEKGKSNLGITLGSHQPRLLEGYLIELPLSNAVQAEMILEEKYMLLEYLRNKLENDKIEIATKIIEGEKNNIPYTNKDKFKIMLDENPQLEILRVKLGLDPDY
jgi:DNA polymerase-3 subunit gamma/tau